MKIFSAAQVKSWDAYTIAHERIRSIDLMERAALACTEWLRAHFVKEQEFFIFCGRGNNGGDGLAIGRLLHAAGYQVHIYITGDAEGSPDFETNKAQVTQFDGLTEVLTDTANFPVLRQDSIIIEALFGTGLSKPPKGLYESLIKVINASGAKVVAIDLPGGLYADTSSGGNDIIKADITLTFQREKLAFLFSENAAFVGKLVVLDIGLSAEFDRDESTGLFLLDMEDIRQIYRPRKDDAHKGDYGYACLVAGSYGMMGAAVLSAAACLRAGVGKLTVLTCKEGYNILQASVPEAMCKTSGRKYIRNITGITDYDVVGFGPGIGRHPSHKYLLKDIFAKSTSPLVLDADALNTLGENKGLLKNIPPGSILTPHPKEFERVVGKTANDFESMQLALYTAKDLEICIVLKGHHTFIASPSGKGYFNSTGNSGMATAGSGDVLTGIITALLAQKYSPSEAARLGVFLHGLAGDLALAQTSKEALIAGDIVDNLADAFRAVSGTLSG